MITLILFILSLFLQFFQNIAGIWDLYNAIISTVFEKVKRYFFNYSGKIFIGVNVFLVESFVNQGKTRLFYRQKH